MTQALTAINNDRAGDLYWGKLPSQRRFPAVRWRLLKRCNIAVVVAVMCVHPIALLANTSSKTGDHVASISDDVPESTSSTFRRPVLRPSARTVGAQLSRASPTQQLPDIPVPDSHVIETTEQNRYSGLKPPLLRPDNFPLITQVIEARKQARYGALKPPLLRPDNFPPIAQAGNLAVANRAGYVPGLQWVRDEALHNFLSSPRLLKRPLRRPPSLHEIACLSQAIYFESRGEALEGRIAVAETILNRVKSERYPDTVCKVVRQGTGLLNQCQFSYHCDGLKENIDELDVYIDIQKLAVKMLSGYSTTVTDGATHFHTIDVSPYWASELIMTASIGRHLFYRGPQ